VTESRLTTLFGSTLRRERERRRLTQQKLATLAGVSQATVARTERGDRGASLHMFERLFSALGVQLTLGVEPLDAQVDAQIELLTAMALAERIGGTDIDRVMNRLSVPHLFDGPTAALLQGAPLPTDAVHIAVSWADVDAFTSWLSANHAQRWHARWEVFGYLPIDPREPGDHRWRTIPGEIRARMCDALPDALRVRIGDREYPVVPLADVSVDDPETARLLARYRQLGNYRDGATR
jgi:transcriptional regulator with XRE-family HTH domain